MQMDILSDALSKIKSYEERGKKEVIIKPSSKLIQNVLDAMKKANYIGEIEKIEDGRGGLFKIQLLGRINKCAAIRPRYPLGIHDFDTWEKQFLPAANFGILIISTPHGVMSQNEALEKHTGGRLLAYVY